MVSVLNKPALPHTDTYDAAGNRTLKNHDGARTTSVYDSANQLTYSQDVSGRTTYTFDADGNQQVVREPGGNRTTYSWDYENRMTLARLPAGTWNTMSYEPEGLRVKLEDASGTKKFVWEATEAADRSGRGEASGGSFFQNYLAETNATDDTQAVYTNDPLTYGRLTSQRRGSTTHWYHFDAIGSTRQLTSSTASVTDTKLYDAWGVQVATSGSTVFPFGYVGVDAYYTDSASSRLYVRARYLVPTIGAWLSVDPVFTSRIDRYSYVRSSPLSRLDPTGLRPKANMRPGVDDAKAKWCRETAFPWPEIKNLNKIDLKKS